jgi:hypothetical protein
MLRPQQASTHKDQAVSNMGMVSSSISYMMYDTAHAFQAQTHTPAVHPAESPDAQPLAAAPLPHTAVPGGAAG